MCALLVGGTICVTIVYLHAACTILSQPPPRSTYICFREALHMPIIPCASKGSLGAKVSYRLYIESYSGGRLFTNLLRDEQLPLAATVPSPNFSQPTLNLSRVPSSSTTGGGAKLP